MLQIDPLTEADIPAALRLSTQAGWNQVEADWRRLVRLWRDRCLAGRLEGRLVATSTLATYYAPAEAVSLGWVGMVLVEEAHRGRGIGTAMLAAAMRTERQDVYGLDATDLGRSVYLKRDFHDAGGIDRWTGHRRDEPATFRAAIAAPQSEADWRELRRFDLASVGFARGELLEHLGREPGVIVRTWRASPGAPLDGYAVRRPGRVADHIGPVVALSDRIAGELIDSLMDEGAADRPVFTDVFRGKLAGWLRARGWSVARSLMRMETGIHTPGSPPLLAGPQVYAAAGFELG